VVDAIAEQGQLQFGVDVTRQRGQHIDLGQVQRGDGGAHLPVEVGQIEAVEVGNMESAYAEAGQREQVDAAHAAHAGNGDALAAQYALLGRRDPAEVAYKGERIGKSWRHQQAPRGGPCRARR
jgi:hypothetical protein